MAKCLDPQFIRRPNKNGLFFHPEECSPRFRDIRPYARDFMAVPCGRCVNCLKNRQNATVSRVYAEAEKRGTFAFVTLTYDEKNLPLAQSLYEIDVETGEMSHIGIEKVCKSGEIVMDFKPEIVSGYYEKGKRIRSVDSALLTQMSDIVASDKPRYIDVPLFDGLTIEGKQYVARITPSVNRKDVRYWLKRSRVRYEREFGKKLDFSYVCCQEYGPRTCRPHYHLALLGLKKTQVEWLVAQWEYGSPVQQKVSFIPRFNKDGSDAFELASKYIGKYMTKGVFECESVKDKAAEKPRIIQSKGLGNSLVERLRDYMLGYDLFGYYDPDSLFCPALHRRLNETELLTLKYEIPKRLVYDINSETKLSVPRIIREKVFYRMEVRDEKKVRKPFAIWRLVSSHLQKQYFDLYNEKFRAFLAKRSEGETFEACSEFNARAYLIGKIAQTVGIEGLQSFYAKSKF